MSLWPPNVHPAGYEYDEDYQQTIIRGTRGKRQVRERLAPTDPPLFGAALTYVLNSEELAEVETFVRALRGPATPFAFYCHAVGRSHEALACGTGDGSTAVFWPPLTSINRGRPYTVKVVGVAKTEGTDFELGVQNRVVQSEDLSQAAVWQAYGGATVTRTGGQTAPSGPATAWRIETSGGSNTLKVYQSVRAVAAERTYTELWVKNLGAVQVNIGNGLGTIAAVPAGGSWLPVALATDPVTGTLQVTFSAPLAGDAMDLLVWHPWAAVDDVYWGAPSADWHYLPTYAAQIAPHAERRQAIAFYSGSIPTIGQAVTLDAAGRKLYSTCALGKVRQAVRVEGFNRYGKQLVIEEVSV